MRVGVLGGGLQGCCVALALADRGIDVTIFDLNDALITRAGAANEGKVHLGYMYAADPSLRTAKRMMAGALAFEPFLKRHLGAGSAAFATSMPATYAVHVKTQGSVEQVADYLQATHALIGEHAQHPDTSYFGMDLDAPLRRWSETELEAAYSREHIAAAFDTPEVAINPVVLARALRDSIAAHSRIELRLGHRVAGAQPGEDGVTVQASDGRGELEESFDQVVNCLWDGRLKLDQSVGLKTERVWMHRLKYGVSCTLPEGAPVPPSTTFVSGPFGEVVSYGAGLTYLTWYPTCLREISHDVAPPDWANYPSEPLRSEILDGTVEAMGEIVHALGTLAVEDLIEPAVKGGAIVAWGETDIYDPGSELHNRYDIGITSVGHFHSIDPGKLTMAPLFAEQIADRIAG
ncbi:FAD-dependent oxidoreductase [Tepidamorphus sp. 3E244]|uniref:FAD-dependent oxidoreductase n=1 Tax=Tepidamorphus sp. 3E244 TaxID=3385498 RepID=UPI0038FCA10F